MMTPCSASSWTMMRMLTNCGRKKSSCCWMVDVEEAKMA